MTKDQIPETRFITYWIENWTENCKDFLLKFFPDSSSITVNVEVLNHGSKHLSVNCGLSAISHTKQKVTSVLLTTL